jgi:hypothetical protein
MIELEKIIAKDPLSIAAVHAYFKPRYLPGTGTVEIDLPRIPAPAAHFIIAAVKSDLFDIATGNRHYKNICIAQLPAAESNPFTIGRNPWAGFITLHGS